MITNFLPSLFLSYCVHVCVVVFVLVCVLDPTPLLEASYSLEERLAQLKSSSPDIEVLVKEILGHWRRHLECLNSAGQLATPLIPQKFSAPINILRTLDKMYYRAQSLNKGTAYRPRLTFLPFQWLSVPI